MFFGEGVIGVVNSFFGGFGESLVKLFLRELFSRNRGTLGERWGWLGVVSGKDGGSSGSRRRCFVVAAAAAAGARGSGWG